MSDILDVFKNYEEFLFRTVKKAGPKLTKEDLQAHHDEQIEYENKTFYCKVCKCNQKIKDVSKHIHRKLDRYDREYIYGQSELVIEL